MCDIGWMLRLVEWVRLDPMRSHCSWSQRELMFCCVTHVVTMSIFPVRQWGWLDFCVHIGGVCNSSGLIFPIITCCLWCVMMTFRYREWGRLDYHRIDKYYSLVRHFFRYAEPISHMYLAYAETFTIYSSGIQTRFNIDRGEPPWQEHGICLTTGSTSTTALRHFFRYAEPISNYTWFRYADSVQHIEWSAYQGCTMANSHMCHHGIDRYHRACGTPSGMRNAFIILQSI